ncbi:MAG: FAD-binding protein [Treponema sp.]|jgi:flavin-dependent dehydrogenase|nr:FAD-binding protein [Treponema sp.]
MYDIAIIGLGPAGATLARLLGGNRKIIAIDSKGSKINKCCGGLLSPDAQKILAQFDLCLPKDVLVDPQIFSVKTMDFDNNLERFYQRYYMNMDRARFDNFLISLIPGEVEICAGSVCGKIEKENNIYRFMFKTNGTERIERAKIIIGADGANSIVRKTFYRKNKINTYISIQEWYDDRTNSPFYSCIFDKSITDSYCWTISKDNYFIIGGAFPVKDSGARFEALKEKIRNSGIALKKPVKREGCLVVFNKNIGSVCTGRAGVYLAGEAAGMISPSSLEGISYSMDSAKILAGVLNENHGKIGRTYFIRTLGIRMKLFLKVLKMPFMYNGFLRKLVMKSGLQAIKKVRSGRLLPRNAGGFAG